MSTTAEQYLDKSLQYYTRVIYHDKEAASTVNQLAHYAGGTNPAAAIYALNQAGDMIDWDITEHEAEALTDIMTIWARHQQARPHGKSAYAHLGIPTFPYALGVIAALEPKASTPSMLTIAWKNLRRAALRGDRAEILRWMVECIKRMGRNAVDYRQLYTDYMTLLHGSREQRGSVLFTWGAHYAQGLETGYQIREVDEAEEI